MWSTQIKLLLWVVRLTGARGCARCLRIFRSASEPHQVDIVEAQQVEGGEMAQRAHGSHAAAPKAAPGAFFVVQGGWPRGGERATVAQPSSLACVPCCAAVFLRGRYVRRAARYSIPSARARQRERGAECEDAPRTRTHLFKSKFHRPTTQPVRRRRLSIVCRDADTVLGAPRAPAVGRSLPLNVSTLEVEWLRRQVANSVRQRQARLSTGSLCVPRRARRPVRAPRRGRRRPRRSDRAPHGGP